MYREYHWRMYENSITKVICAVFCTGILGRARVHRAEQWNNARTQEKECEEKIRKTVKKMYV